MNKRLIAAVLMGPLLLGQFAFSNAGATERNKVKAEILHLKEEIQVFGIDENKAFDHFTARLDEEKITPADVVRFVEHSASPDEAKVFEVAFTDGIGKSPELMKSMLATHFAQNQVTGADFKMSCGLGLGISIPVLLAGLTLGAIYIANLHHDHTIQAEYASQVSRANGKYYSEKGQLEVTIASQNSTVATDKAQIDYLNQKISSGVYSADDRELFRQQISSLNTHIASVQNSLQSDTAKLAVVQANYDQEMISFSDRKEGDLTHWKDAQKVTAITAVVGLGAGIPLFISTTGDCW